MARRTTEWFAAPLSLVYIAGTSREAEAAERKFKDLAKLKWMLDTYEAGKASVLAARAGS